MDDCIDLESENWMDSDSGTKFCISCHQDGGDDVLICSEIWCPIAIHRKCASGYDGSSKYYCWFCESKNAELMKVKLKRKAMKLKSHTITPEPSNVGMNDGRGEEKEVKAQTQNGVHVEEDIVVVGSKRKSRDVKRKQRSEEKQSLSKGEIVDSSDDDNEPLSVFKWRNLDTSNRLSSSTKLESLASGKSIKQPPATQTNFSFANNGKRKRRIWNPMEVKMLQKAVEQFSSTEKSFPWKQILESGRGVFDPTRQPSDLKDKWRNLCKGSSSNRK